MAMGIAALLPGITHMREILMQQENEYRDLLHELQFNGLGPVQPRKRGRPSNASKALLEAQAQLLPAAMATPDKTTKAPPQSRGETLPEMIGDDYTRHGAAKYLGLSIMHFDLVRKTLGGIPSKMAINPTTGVGMRRKVVAFSRASLDALAKKAKLNATAAPAKKQSAEGRAGISKAQRSFWAGLTKEQRAAEVARRMAGKAAKKKGNLTRRGTKPAAKYGWAGMTKEERSAEMRRRMAIRSQKAQAQA